MRKKLLLRGESTGGSQKQQVFKLFFFELGKEGNRSQGLNSFFQVVFGRFHFRWFRSFASENLARTRKRPRADVPKRGEKIIPRPDFAVGG